jgi:hypothetical protein
MDLTLGLGAVGAFILGAVLLLAGYYKVFPAFAKVLKFAGAVFVLIGLLSYAGFSMTTTPAAQSVGETAVYDVTVSESKSYESIQADSHLIVNAITYNTTSNTFIASSGTIVFNTTILRADALLTDSVTQVSIGAIPLVDVTGAASQPILAKNTDSTYNADMVKAGGISTHESINVLVPAGGSAWCNVTLNLNALAVDSMTLYESQNIPIYIGGELWTVQCELVSIHT